MRDDLLELLTAAIDGELSPAEQWTVHRLLCESEPARTLFARLQSDSIRLKNLSKAAPANLAARVLSKLPQTEPAPAPKVRRDRSRRWLVVGLAASVLLAIASGSLLHLNQPGRTTAPDSPLAAKASPNEPSIAEVLPRTSAPAAIPPAPPVPPARNVAELAPVPPPDVPSRVEEIPPPRPKGVDVFVAPPLRPIPPLDRFIVRVPLLVSLAELDRDDTRERLLEELRREPAIRVDLFTRDLPRGLELLQGTARESGIGIFTDTLTLDRVKRKQSTAVVLYTESLTASEIRDLLVKISTVDAKNTQRAFDSLHATAAVNADQAALKDVLGTDPGLWKRPAGEPKPISAGTGDELTRNLTAKPNDKPAVLLTFTPAASRTHPAMSKELKEFLAKRGDRKASAVPVLIVLR